MTSHDSTSCACEACLGSDHAISTARNLPGQPQLSYRAGTHSSFKQAMIAQLHRQPALAALATRDDTEPVIALIDAWATVLDVVSFYNERAINETNLRTSTELRSVLELARAIGYELRPGVAANALLRFTVDEVKEQPNGTLIPRGSRVQSVPGQDELPQTFETSADTLMHPAWNELLPASMRYRAPAKGDHSLCLRGTQTQLRPGDGLLIVGDERATESTKSNQWDFRVLKTVTPAFNDDPARSYTLVTWERALGSLTPPMDVAKKQPRVFAMRQRAAVFGHNAPAFGSLTEPLKSAVSTSGATEWKDFALTEFAAQGVLDLDAVYPAITLQSWVVLTMGDNDPSAVDSNYRELYGAKKVIEAGASNFLISAKVTRLTLEGENHAKFTNRRRDITVFAVSDELQLSPMPFNDDVAGWSIEMDDLRRPLPEDRSLLLSGVRADNGEAATETIIVDRCVGNIVHLKAPLKRAYSRRSVRIYANCVPATHGETKKEVLGSGDASRAFQKFALKQAPLTHVSAPTASGTASTLELRVNGLLWQGTPHLHGAEPKDRVFITRRDDEGRSHIATGDGTQGARLPTGTENVRARYRVGLGLAGNVRADQLSLLLDRPLGVREVTNPDPASGGADGENLAQARQNAPVTVLTLDRVVSLRDYEDFARSFAGIGKALATWVWSGEQRLVHLTIAGADGQPVPMGSPLHRNLVAAIDGARHADQPVRVAAAAERPFRLVARVDVQPDAQPRVVFADVTQTLQRAFAFAPRAFGQAVTSSEVIAAIQHVPGVLAVDLDALHFADQPVTREPRLPARVARWEAGALLPAELLLLAPNGLNLLPEP